MQFLAKAATSLLGVCVCFWVITNNMKGTMSASYWFVEMGTIYDGGPLDPRWFEILSGLLAWPSSRGPRPQNI